MTSHKGATFRDLLVQHITEFKRDDGIIFVDEVDKWCQGAIGNDAETTAIGRRMQAEALRMMTSEKAVLHDEMELEEGDTDEAITFRTSNCLWIMAGAFTGIDKLIRNRLNNYFLPPEELWKEITTRDLIQYGVITELAGRVQTLAWSIPLTPMQMVEVLEKQEVPRWMAMFQMVDCELVIERGALYTCSERALHEKTGARGAVAFLRRGMEDIYTEVSTHHVDHLTVNRVNIETGRIDLEVVAS